ncbi:MAG: hypothetical protein QM771_11275 [Nitrospira sp.]
MSVEEETEAVAGLALQGPTSFAILRDAGFAGVERLKVFDLAEFAHDGADRRPSRAPASPAISATNCSCRADKALSLWDRLMAAGELRGIRAIGYTALNRARLEAGLIVANADFTTSEHAIRTDRLHMPDEIGLGFMIDSGQGTLQRPPRHPRGARRRRSCVTCWSDWRSKATSRPSTPSSTTGRARRSDW